MKKFDVQIHKDFDDLLKNKWENFETKSSFYFFQKYSWQKLWFNLQKKYKTNIKCSIVLVYENDDLILIFPFCIFKKFKLRVLNFSGFPFSDYNSPLIKKNLKISNENFNEIWNKIIFKLKGEIDCTVLSNQPLKIGDNLNPIKKFLNLREENYYYGIDLKKDFELKKNELKNINYQMKKLEKIGKLDYCVANNIQDQKKILKFIIKNKSDQYDETGAWNVFKVSLYKRFFLLSNLYLNDYASISFISLNNQILSAHSGFIFNKRFYYLFPIYDQKFRRYSPGKILMKKIIDDCKKKSINYFDLTIGKENYKNNYSNNLEKSYYYSHYSNLRGFLYISFLRIYIFLKRKIK